MPYWCHYLYKSINRRAIGMAFKYIIGSLIFHFNIHVHTNGWGFLSCDIYQWVIFLKDHTASLLPWQILLYLCLLYEWDNTNRIIYEWHSFHTDVLYDRGVKRQRNNSTQYYLKKPHAHPYFPPWSDHTRNCIIRIHGSAIPKIVLHGLHTKVTKY